MPNRAANAGYDRNAQRRAVNLSLNEDLVSRAKGLTRNLSGTVQALLAAYVREKQARKQAEDERLDQVLIGSFERSMR